MGINSNEIFFIYFMIYWTQNDSTKDGFSAINSTILYHKTDICNEDSIWIDVKYQTKDVQLLLLWNKYSFIPIMEIPVPIDYNRTIIDNERNGKMGKLDSLLATDI